MNEQQKADALVQYFTDQLFQKGHRITLCLVVDCAISLCREVIRIAEGSHDPDMKMYWGHVLYKLEIKIHNHDLPTTPNR